MNTRSRYLAAAFFVVLLGAAALSLASNYTYTTIDFPGAIDSAVGDINNLGQMVGGYQLPDGSRHGFLLSGGVFSTIDDPNATFGSENHGINSFGRIVGPYNLNSLEGNHAFEGVHGFLYNGGTFSPIDFPGSNVSNTTPYKINDSGTIVGVYRIMGGPGNGFLLSGGTYTTINFPGGVGTHLNGINNAGDIVGQYKDALGGPHHGFLDSGGTFTTIDFPGATDTIATGIDNSGNIVGGYKTSTVPELGFLRLAGGNFSTIAFPGAFATFATGINDQGSIVGLYQDQSEQFHGFLATPVTITCPFGGGGPSCANPTVTSASNCTVLEMNGVMVSITGPSAVDGSVCIGQKGTLSMSGSARVSEFAELAAGAKFNRSGSATVGGGVNKNVDLSSQISDAQNASTSAAGMCSSFSGSVTGSQTITGSGSTDGVCLQNLKLSGGSVLTLTGPSGTTFIINVSGTLALSGASKIVVSGAVQPKDVLINVIGSGGDAALTGGSALHGTLLAPRRKIDVSASFVSGQVISNQNIAITSGGQVNCSCTPTEGE